MAASFTGCADAGGHEAAAPPAHAVDARRGGRVDDGAAGGDHLELEVGAGQGGQRGAELAGVASLST